MKLLYDNVTHTSINNKGVEIRIPGFGNTTTVEWLDPSRRSFGIYFATIISHLLPLGYVRGVNLHGAPYDFRKAANEHGDYFIMVKKLIEDTYAANDETPVIILTHSMGSPMMLYFLLNQVLNRYIPSVVVLFHTYISHSHGSLNTSAVSLLWPALGAAQLGLLRFLLLEKI